METLDTLFSPASPLRPFPVFQTPHFIALGALVALNLFLIAWGRRSPESRPLIRYTMMGILLLNITSFHLWHFYYGFWEVRTMLPLHLCGVMQWASLFLWHTRSPRLYEFVYFLGIGGATQALLTPDSGGMGFPHFLAFETIVSHGSIVTAALYFTFVEGYRPTWASVRRVLLWTQLYVVVIFFLNFALGSNYMFLAAKPNVATLMDLLGPWPLYIFWLEVLGLLTIFLLFLPWAFRERRAQKEKPQFA